MMEARLVALLTLRLDRLAAITQEHQILLNRMREDLALLSEQQRVTIDELSDLKEFLLKK